MFSPMSGWLFGCLVVWLVGCLVGQLVGRSGNWQDDTKSTEQISAKLG